VTAHGQDRLVLRYLAEALSQLAKRDVLRTGDMPGLPFVGFAHVEEMQIGRSRASFNRLHA